MKKLALVALFAASTIAMGNAQNVLNNPDNKPFWGVRASFDVSMPSKVTYEFDGEKEKSKDMKNGVGFSVGAIYNLPIVANFYFEPGVSLFYNTFKQNDDFIKDEIDLPGVDLDIKHNSFRQFGMRIPLNLGYHFDFTDQFKLSVFTGPMLQVGFSCDNYQTIEAKAMGQTLKAHSAASAYKKYDGVQLFNRFDCAWNVGVGFTYDKYYLGVSGAFGMCNMINKSVYDGDEKVKANMNTLQVTLGYNF